MKKYFYLLLSLLSILACSSPQKSFDKGKYEKAYNAALKNIKKGKKSRRDKTILNKSFDEIVAQKSNEAETYLYSDMIEDWELAYANYDDLLRLYYSGKVYLDSDFDSEMRIVESFSDSLGMDIALNYHELGLMSMDDYSDSGNKLYAQEAFAYFQKTQSYDPDFTNITTLMDEAFDRGVVLILVEADAPFGRNYEWTIDRRFSDIERESEDFYQIVYERMVDADCKLEIDFSSLERSINQSRTVETFSERIEDGYNTSVDSSGRTIREPIYRTVEGAVTIIAENIRYYWGAAVNVRGSREYCDFRDRTFNEEEVITIERYELSGDERAIPNRYKNNRNNNSGIDEDDIAEELIDELYREISRYYF